MARRAERAEVRCAVYTRVSTAGQAEGDFSSIDNQRESARALIRSQQDNGWDAIEPSFDDGGFSGSSLQRPALQRLLAAIADRKVDVVIVYKLDRLSRNQRDLLELLDHFAKYGVAFKSVTQNFDTTGPMGKAMLGMLGVFAELERGMISERTRDKMLAARRRGKWTGGPVPLGYDLDNGKLRPNADEAARVRAIYELYLEHSSLTQTVAALARRHWATKSWRTKHGHHHRGKAFSVDALRRLLTNPAYVGKARCGEELHEGEQKAILDEALFEAVQLRLKANGNDGGRSQRNVRGALLKGILRCAACDAAMSPSMSHRGQRRYTYYRCTNSLAKGAHACPTRAIRAAAIESVVYDQIKGIGSDPALVEAVVTAAGQERERELKQLAIDMRAAARDEAALATEQRRLAAALGGGGRRAKHAGDALQQVELQQVANRIRREELEKQQAALDTVRIDARELRTTLAEFAPVWEVLEPRERAQLVQLLIERVDYDGQADEASITFRSEGLAHLATQGRVLEAAS